MMGAAWQICQAERRRSSESEGSASRVGGGIPRLGTQKRKPGMARLAWVAPMGIAGPGQHMAGLRVVQLRYAGPNRSRCSSDASSTTLPRFDEFHESVIDLSFAVQRHREARGRYAKLIGPRAQGRFVPLRLLIDHKCIIGGERNLHLPDSRHGHPSNALTAERVQHELRSAGAKKARHEAGLCGGDVRVKPNSNHSRPNGGWQLLWCNEGAQQPAATPTAAANQQVALSKEVPIADRAPGDEASGQIPVPDVLPQHAM